MNLDELQKKFNERTKHKRAKKPHNIFISPSRRSLGVADYNAFKGEVHDHNITRKVQKRAYKFAGTNG